MYIYFLLLSSLLIPRLSLVTATITCSADFGEGINIRDCQQALSDLHAGMIQDDILHRDPVVRRFGRGSPRNYRDRLPKGFPWKSCALGLDIYGNNPKQQASSTWKPMYDEIRALMDQCVKYGGGIGGYTVKHGFRFVVASPHSPNVIGTCLTNPQQDNDLGECILSRAKVSAQAAQEARQAMREQRAQQRGQVQQHSETGVAFSAHEINALQGMLSPSAQAGPSSASASGLYNTSALAQLGSSNGSDPFGAAAQGLASGSGSHLGLYNASLGRLEEANPGQGPSGLQSPVGSPVGSPPYLPRLQSPAGSSPYLPRLQSPPDPSLPDFAAIMRGVRHASDPASLGMVPVPVPSPALRISPLSRTRLAPPSTRPAEGTSWIENGVWVQQGPAGPQGVWMLWEGIWQPLGRAQPTYTMQGEEGTRYKEYTGLIPEQPVWVFTLVNGHRCPLVGGTPPQDSNGVIWVARGTPMEAIDVGRSQVFKNRPPLMLR